MTKTKPYFQLEKVLDGAFTVAQNYTVLWRDFDIDKYNDEVTTYEVKDIDDQLVAIFYADFFQEKEKKVPGWPLINHNLSKKV
jgi:peptidyl-dipeptidase Dcp